ncbi:MAG: HAMP domain-containing protein [Nitrospirales bacterium]|nr:HAMP domain-containing protein [Nitrospirales bacterium]
MFISLFTLLIVSAFIAWTTIYDTHKRLISAQEDKAALLSDIIKQSVMLLMLENRWPELQSQIEELSKSNPELEVVRIFHPLTGKIIISSHRAEIGSTINQQVMDRFRKQKEGPFTVRHHEISHTAYIKSIMNLPECHRCHSPEQKIRGVLNVELSLSGVRSSIMGSANRDIFSLTLGFIIIGIIYTLMGERLINRPLQRLMLVMKKVETGDLSVRSEEKGVGEFAYLSARFNTMIASLEITEKELEMFHMQQMERAAKLASLGEIVSGIAHEIKNPLAGISCAMQVCYTEFQGDDNKKMIVSEVLNQINRLDKIVKDLLTYAKPGIPRIVPARVNEVMAKALFFVNAEAERNRVRIVNHVNGEIPEVLMDPNQIQQVFMNIIINAIQAMGEGGTLTISASVETRASLEGQRNLPETEQILAVNFQDTGKGIPEEEISSIFQPFYTKKTRGTGLGLSISQKIIQEHGGVITVRSEPGQGSTFTIYLPIKGEEAS